MLKMKFALVVALSTALFLRSTPVEAKSSRIITCESNDGRYTFCEVNTRGKVTLKEQLSDDSCRRDRDWGYNRDGIWVDNGCRGEFEVGSSKSEVSTGEAVAIAGGVIAIAAVAAALSSRSSKDKNDDSITCKSDGEYKYCKANTSRGVELRRQMSSAGCWEDDTWGYDRRGVWVDRGCEAIFDLR